MSKPDIKIHGNFMAGSPMPPEHAKNVKAVMKDVSDINALNAWEDLSTFRKLYLTVAYILRGKW